MPWPKGIPRVDPRHTDLIVRWYAKLGTCEAVAAHLRCHVNTVYRHLDRAGVERRQGRPPK